MGSWRERFSWTAIKGRLHLHAFAFLCVLGMSGGALLQKLAALHTAKKVYFVLFFALSILVFIAFSVIWQQILKRLSQREARVHRSLLVLWVMLLGAIFFVEHLSVSRLVGALMIFGGLLLLQVRSHAEKEREQQGLRSSFFHFYGDVNSAAVYRDLKPASDESFLFNFIARKRREAQIHRELRRQAQEKSREEALEREAKEALARQASEAEQQERVAKDPLNTGDLNLGDKIESAQSTENKEGGAQG